MPDTQYIATLRAVYRSTDDVSAILIADQIKVNGEKDLDEEDGDTLDVTQVTSNQLDLTAEESVVELRKARNLCIRSKTKWGYDTARELDKFIFLMVQRMEHNQGYELSGYDWGKFLEVVEQVLAGRSPTHF